MTIAIKVNEGFNSLPSPGKMLPPGPSKCHAGHYLLFLRHTQKLFYYCFVERPYPASPIAQLDGLEGEVGKGYGNVQLVPFSVGSTTPAMK